MSTTTPAPLRMALTPAEAAEALGCSEGYFNEHIGHELAWIRRGRKRLVSIAELERWLSANGERITA